MKGILFKEDLFKAIIEGKKTQTRRIIPANNVSEELFTDPERGDDFKNFVLLHARYKKGETVYMKEPFNADTDTVFYRYLTVNEKSNIGWKNKLFMPAKYARYFIKVSNVRVERLLDISEEDAKAEGVLSKGPNYWYNYLRDHYHNAFAKSSFQSLWIKIHGENSWYSNPWVFAYDFELTEKPKS